MSDQSFELTTADGELHQFQLIESISGDHAKDLHLLIQSQWWGGRRTLEQVVAMLRHTTAVVGAVDLSTGQLVGFARALSDSIFRATLYDVAVDKRFQGCGLGGRIVECLLDHELVRSASIIYLACEAQLEGFYRQWGFERYHGRASWMIKAQREE